MTRALPSSLRAALRDARKTRGWSQTRLGDELGVSRRAVVAWEGGERLPSAGTARALAHVLDLDAGDRLLLFAACTRKRFQ